MEAAALIEFAVALPLLVVLVVGIFDFGGAFNLKQELNNAVREGADFGASQPTNDLALAKPPSVDAVRYLVASYLQASRINDCGLATMSQPGSGGGLIWVYTTTGSCVSTLQLTIQRICIGVELSDCIRTPEFKRALHLRQDLIPVPMALQQCHSVAGSRCQLCSLKH